MGPKGSIYYPLACATITGDIDGKTTVLDMHEVFNDLRDVVELSHENAYIRNPVITLPEINNGIFVTGDIPDSIASVDIPSALTQKEGHQVIAPYVSAFLEVV